MRSHLVVVALVVASTRAHAGVTEPEKRADDAFDFMNLLTRYHLHDLDDEDWNVYGQATWIQSFKLPFHAPYTNVGGSTNSLLPDFETSFTGTFTLYGGVKLWEGAEFYL